MNKWMAVWVGCGVLVAAVAYAAESGDATEGVEVELLRQQVAALEARVAALETRQLFTFMPETPVLRLTRPNFEAVPKGWQPFQFNGVDFYIVNADQDSGEPRIVPR